MKKNKFVAFAVVLLSVGAPTIASATSLTTTQGGTPVYSCLDGQTLQGDKCLVPATPDTTQNVPAEKYSALKTTETQAEHCAIPTDAQIPYYFKPVSNIKFKYINRFSWGDFNFCAYSADWTGNSNFSPTDELRLNNPSLVIPAGSVDVYTCPNGGTLDGTDCVTKAAYVKTIPGTPATTVSASVAGSNGGSLVASVTGFLEPVWNFLMDKLFPAIAILVILGIAVRTTIKAVKKYSKKVA